MDDGARRTETWMFHAASPAPNSANVDAVDYERPCEAPFSLQLSFG